LRITEIRPHLTPEKFQRAFALFLDQMKSDQQLVTLFKLRHPGGIASVNVDWVDCELGVTYSKDHGIGCDTLLELRRVLLHLSPNRMITKFLSILPRLEKNHHLLGYRIHILLSSQFRLKVSDPLDRNLLQIVPLPRSRDRLDMIRWLSFKHGDTFIPPGDIRLEIILANQA
jgi:hypothetical protein